jgi:lipopolysaccharide cholinephosphotransferase
MNFLKNISLEEISFLKEPSFDYEWDFKRPDKNISTKGLSEFEPWGCWSDGKNVEIKIERKLLITSDFIYIYFRPFLNEHLNKFILIIVTAGSFVRTLKLSYSENFNISFVKIPTNKLYFDEQHLALVHFSIVNPRSPSDCGSTDTRLLGLSFFRLGIGDNNIEDLSNNKINVDYHTAYVPHCFDERIALEAYRLAFIIQKIFVYYGVAFYFSSGTLLGAARHGGMIPWDDDLDLCLLESQIEFFESHIIAIFDNLGWVVNKDPDPKNWAGYQILSKNREIRNFSSPYCVIFIVNEDGGKLIDSKGFLRARPLIDDVFPTKLMKFGANYISVPKRHEVVLTQDFGEHWNLVAKKYNHSYHEIILNEERREEYLPAGPFVKLPFKF